MTSLPLLAAYVAWLLERIWEATGIAPSELVKFAEDRGKQLG